MNPLDRLSEYLRTVEKRLRVLTWTRGAAIAAGAALVSTIVLVLIANSYAFSSSSLLASRSALFVAIALAVGLGLLIPLLRLNAKRAAKEAEEKFPEFEQRLLTFTEKAKTNERDPFLQLLAADTLEAGRNAEADRVTPQKTIVGFASLALCAAAILIWLGMAGPGFLGYGTALLWAGPPKAAQQAFYDIIVEPGDRTVRKKSDQLVTARMVGFTAPRARVFAKYNSVAKWEEASMRPQTGGPNHEFLFSGVPESLEYYVEAGGVKSKTYKLNVIDLPGVKKIRVTYHYPAWSGMKDSTEDPGGDLRAVEGTTAELAVETDRPLPNGVILLDDETRIPLKNGVARVPIQKDGLYHIASIEKGDQGIGRDEDVRLTDDYFIEARKDSAPTVRIRKPGRDAKANPVEEVPVQVEAEDDFALQDVSLRYSVNGGPEKTVAIPGGKGQKTAEGKTLLTLEDFKLAPGDIVSMYAVAKDARATSQTDMFFIEAQPYEREFTQSQQGGGGGGGGEQEDQNGISKRQKEIIAATWNQIRDTRQNKATAAETAKFLADMQAKLRDQARSLAERMKARDLAGTNAEFQSFVKSMETAVEAMGPASDKLKASAWKDALAPEQKALQYLLRAESVFRQIQVAFGQRGGGGGGGGSGGRDLESLFDLELDTEKNQYEGGQQAAASGEQRKKEIDEALQKLEQLAKRQQELAEQQRKNPQGSQQRYQQEMLRREAEQLRRQMEQMSGQSGQQGQQSQNGQPGQTGQSQGQQGQQGQQPAGGQSQGGQQGQQSAQQRAQAQMEAMRRQQQQQQQPGQAQLDKAIESLKQAEKAMQQAAASQAAGTPQSAADARRAADGLKQANDLLAGMRQQESGNQLSELARKSQELASRNQDFGNRLRKEFGSGQPGSEGGMPSPKAQELVAENRDLQGKVKELEKQMQAAARDLATTDRDAAGKIRRALGDMQQDELDRNMNIINEALRRGYGSIAAMREAPITQSLNNVRDKLKEVEAAGLKGGSEKGLQDMLDRAENIRRQMEAMTRSLTNGQKGQGQGQKGQGQQPGQGQQAQQGQGQQGQGQGQQSQSQGQGQQGQGGGQTPGQNGQSAQGQGNGQQGGGQQPGQGSRGGSDNRGQAGGTFSGGGPGGYNGTNFGQRGPLDGAFGYQEGNPERTYREAQRDLGRLREGLGDNPEIARDVQDLIRQMQRIDPGKFADDPVLLGRINSQILAGLEQIELQLRRKVEEQQGGNVRSGASEKAPDGYANSIAEYFRKLSKEK